MDEKLIIQYDNLVSRYKEIVADKFSPQDFIEYNEILFSAHSCAIVHIPEHTRSLSGSLLGYKTIP
ncbi:hypothetical protein [Phocaeicola sp.]|uniref:hypothetical protein n=1 Tax=Phocaeicola sp. TaxID=2773926 RepID=UPI003AF41656